MWSNKVKRRQRVHKAPLHNDGRNKMGSSGVFRGGGGWTWETLTSFLKIRFGLLIITGVSILQIAGISRSRKNSSF